MPAKPKHEQQRDHAKQRAFIAAFRKTLSVKAAAAATRIDARQHHAWLRTNDANARIYQAAWRDVQEECAQALEDEAIRRAYEGVRKQLYFKGKPMKTGRGRNARYAVEVNYSDQLLITLLKRFKPTEYREHVATEVTGSVEIVDRLQAARKRLIEMQKNDEPKAG